MSAAIYLILASIIGLLYPIYGLLTAQSAKVFLLEHKDEKSYAFFSTIFLQWLFTLLVLGTLLFYGDSWAHIGLGYLQQPWKVVSLLSLAFLFWQMVQLITVTPKAIPKLKKRYQAILFVMPSNPRDYRTAIALAFTAGICEELLFRGFLFWQIHQYLPLLAAIILCNVLFAIGHSYTGLKNTTVAFLMGLTWSGIYQYSGSLWWPMLSHIIIDVYSLTMGYKLLQMEESIVISNASNSEQ